MRTSLFRCLLLVPFLALCFAPVTQAESDTILSIKAKIALLTTDGVSVSDVKVDTHAGAVILHGKVRSEHEKLKAEAAVRDVGGVKSVQDLLQVVPLSIREAVSLSDSELKEKVRAALDTDPALKGATLKVKSVDASVVLLSGTAETLDQKLEAIERAYSVRGVVRVASEIQAPVSAE
jgi:osmotically-inducible protein OsmY